ncbi:glycosyltransferase family 2 protein [Thiorhodococcus fuscus]|uniref:Glycosyltransferase family 2 protein n=1 Tax=Thiorhodococcus fuscus TaxID=527200 RepID=A0ABW4YC54_9GAMM
MAVSSDASDVTVILINYRTPEITIRCLRSLLCLNSPPGGVLVLDNAPRDTSLQEQISGIDVPLIASVDCIVSPENLGFAGGCNLAIERALVNSRCRYILLLNNDAVALQSLIPALKATLDSSPKAGMVGGRMHATDDPDAIDTLGIALHISLMPANRIRKEDRFFGPTGGCCLMTREFLGDIRTTYGYVFDKRFFCYCEDTDLAWRANLLGYRSVYVDELVALHQGQASTGKGYNAFIAYHGLRNVIWMHVKLLPMRLLLRYGAWLLLAHMLLIMRHLLAGHPGVVFRAYSDAAKRFPELLLERRMLKPLRAQGAGAISARLSSSFYQSGYARVVLAQLGSMYRQLFARQSVS